MKNPLKHSLISIVRVVVIVGIIAVATTDCSLSGSDHSASVLYQDGIVEVKSAGSDSWTPFVEGTAVGEGDELRTYAEGSVELELPDGSVLLIGPNSHVVIREMGMVEVTRKDSTRLELVFGRIRALVTDRTVESSLFEVETENVTIGVRGTDFGVTHDRESQRTDLICLDGTVAVESKEREARGMEPILVAANEGLAVISGVLPGSPQVLTRDVIDRFQREMGLNSERAKRLLRMSGEYLEEGGERMMDGIEEGVDAIGDGASDGAEVLRSGGENAIKGVRRIFE
jgi:ferric-dicitrate binding protein FerR (iron transport regulator)